MSEIAIFDEKPRFSLKIQRTSRFSFIRKIPNKYPNFQDRKHLINTVVLRPSMLYLLYGTGAVADHGVQPNLKQIDQNYQM